MKRTTTKAAGRVSIDSEALGLLRTDLEKHKKTELQVGIFGPKNNRPTDDLNNASLGTVHEFGSIKRNIPERSFLRAPLIGHLPGYVKSVGPKPWRQAFEGRGIVGLLELLGIAAEGVVQDAFDTGGFGRWLQWSRRYARRRELSTRKITGTMNFIGPVIAGSLLIESGEMRQSVSSRIVQHA